MFYFAAVIAVHILRLLCTMQNLLLKKCFKNMRGDGISTLIKKPPLLAYNGGQSSKFQQAILALASSSDHIIYGSMNLRFAYIVIGLWRHFIKAFGRMHV